MNGWQRFWGHLRTITAHRNMVVAHCFRAGIGFQGLFHDLSKYTPTEFLPGVRFFDGHHSPTEDERKTYGYSQAWMHHKGRNRHHWEYWTDFNIEKHIYESVPMPRRYVTEMICDRMAASKIYNGEKYTDRDSLNYLTRSKSRDNMHQQTYDELLYFLTLLAEQGEEKMFAELRRWHRQKK